MVFSGQSHNLSPNPTVFEFMPCMGITLATIFTMLRLANKATMRQVKLGVIQSLKPMLSLLLPNDDLQEQLMEGIMQRHLDPKGLQEMVPMLCTVHLLIREGGQGRRAPGAFPDLISTLLPQLSSGQGPEAVSPILKTRGLVQTGTLPEEINLQSQGGEQVGAEGFLVPQVPQYWKLLLGKSLNALREPMSTRIASEGMDTLGKVLAQLWERDTGPSFDAISKQCRAFFDSEKKLLRLKAFTLFGKLAKMVWISKKHFFKDGSEESLDPPRTALPGPLLRGGAALQEVQLDLDAAVRRAALETPKILDTRSQHQLLASLEVIS
ncbi:Maestro Heat-Like Repeat-Containing Protein Family Member 2A [Manis pentadactyla]|nr:Maestro Heat-Like Repeat-Containing Protein Family Member 2A [Manis pentadactyla]